MQFNDRFSNDFLIKILEEYRDSFDIEKDQENWFNDLRECAIRNNFAKRAKDYKKAPEEFVGHVGDYAEIIRIATTAKTSTPNFYDVLRILGKERITERINHTISIIKKG